MKLHANAKVSLKGRELLIDRVLAAGWSLTEAAKGGWSQRAHRRQVAGAMAS
jgi:hypothetical protein